MIYPRYFIGQYQHILDLQAVEKDGAGVYQYFHATEDPKPDTVVYVVMRNPIATPHPHWRELPHIHDQTPIKTAMAPPAGQPENRAVLLAAWASTAVPIADTDTTFKLFERIHKKHAKGFI